MPTAGRKLRDPVQHAPAIAPVKPSKVVQPAGKRAARRRRSPGEDAVRGFATAVEAELRARHAAGRPYSTLNTSGEVVFVHPDGTVRVGRAPDSALAH